MSAPVRHEIKRIGMVVEVEDGQIFTVFTDAPGVVVEMSFDPGDSGFGTGDVLVPLGDQRRLSIAMDKIKTWTLSLFDPVAQRERLDSIQKGLHS
jgi:hypothetical protein